MAEILPSNKRNIRVIYRSCDRARRRYLELNLADMTGPMRNIHFDFEIYSCYCLDGNEHFFL